MMVRHADVDFRGSAVASTCVHHRDSASTGRVTVSVGVSEARGADKNEEEVVHRADSQNNSGVWEVTPMVDDGTGGDAASAASAVAPSV